MAAEVCTPQTLLLLLCGPPAVGKSELAEQLRIRTRCGDEGDIGFIIVTYDVFYPKDERGIGHTEKCSSMDCDVNTSEFSSKRVRSHLNTCLERFIITNKLNARQHKDYPEIIPSEDEWTRFCRCVSVSKGVRLSENGRVRCSANLLVIVLDDNMMLRGIRQEYHKMARDYGLRLCTVYVTSKICDALERNTERGLPVPQETVKRIHGIAEPPSDRESNVLLLNSSDYSNSVDFVEQNWATIWSVISQALTTPPPNVVVEENTAEKEASREVTLRSCIHQAELILRKCISNEMSSIPNTDNQKKKAHFKILDRVKKNILDRIKCGNLSASTFSGEGGSTSSEFREYIKRTFEESLRNALT